MQKNKWLTLSEYSIKYKVSVSTLRRRIKGKKVNCIYEDGKYFLDNRPLKDHRFNNTEGDLTHHQNFIPEATEAPPHNYGSFGTKIEANKKTISETQRGVSEDVKFMVKELKNAYTLNLKEKEEQILILKDEITDLKMLVHALENQIEKLKIGPIQNQNNELLEPIPEPIIEDLNPQPIELEYIPTPTIELANDWLDDDL